MLAKKRNSQEQKIETDEKVMVVSPTLETSHISL